MTTLRLSSTLALAACMAGHAGIAGAADSFLAAPTSVQVGVGPLGLSVGAGKQLNENWRLRLGVHSGTIGNIRSNDDISGIDYEIRSKSKPGLSALADWYPLQDSGFHLSGGLILGRFEGKLHGRPNDNGNYDINGNIYSAAQVGELNGRVKYNSISPYLGVGWESKALGEKGWRFASELGVFYFGKAKASLSASKAAAGSALQRDVDAERGALAKNGLGVGLSLGATYAF